MADPVRGRSGLLDGIAVTRHEVERYVAMLTARRASCSWEGNTLWVKVPAELAEHVERVRESLRICYPALSAVVVDR